MSVRLGAAMPEGAMKNHDPAGVRLARWVLGWAVLCWPAESRAWGMALAAEVDETTNTFEAVRWSLGGIMFLGRSVLASGWKWMRLPAGASLSGGAGVPEGPGLLPKRSRLFTVAVLACVAVLLLLPAGRVAVQTVTASWLAFMPTHSERRALDKLAAQAEKAKDAETLAFVALSPMQDPRHEAERRTEELVARTVSLDPSIIYINLDKNKKNLYYTAQKEWVERLQASDPDNAVPILIEASALADQKLSASPGHPNDDDYRSLAADPQWMALMGRAYAAPKYDSYLSKHIRVMRDVWDRNPKLPPDIFLMGFWSHAIPNLFLTRRYAEIELDQAKKALEAGDTKKAEALTQRVAAYGARMMGSSGTAIEDLIGVAISRMADMEFVEIYTVDGRLEEARRATAHMDELEQSVRHGFARVESGRAERARTFHRQAAFVQICVILGGIALLCSVVGIFSLEVWRKPAAQTGLRRRVMCFAADWAPVTLLVASGAFLTCFLPFQKVLTDFRTSSFQPADEMRISDAMWSLIMVPEYLLGFDAAVMFWSAVTISLAALAIGVVAWGVYRTRRGALSPA